MIRILTVMMIVMLATPALAVDFSQRDKQIHAGGSAVVTIASYAALKQLYPDTEDWKLRLSAAAFTLGLGFAKEGLDSRAGGTGFSWEDVGADTAGVTTGVLLTTPF